MLQLGGQDWRKLYNIPSELEWIYEEKVTETSKKEFDILVLDRAPLDEEVEALQNLIRAYTLFVTTNVDLSGNAKYLFDCKEGRVISDEEIPDLISREFLNYYRNSYGESISLEELSVSRNFHGKVKWHGNCFVNLTGSFGKEYCQVAMWRRNILVDRRRPIDLWLEYEKDDTVEVKLVVRLFSNGSVSDISETYEFDENDLKKTICLESLKKDSVAYFYLMAKGRGELNIKALHYRHSRKEHGVFLPGGERRVTSKREEIFFYYDPGDMKPPLNVYFSNYKPKEGFEGYYLMKSLGCPFLLISEARLEGGSFYMGSEEFEKMIVSGIRKYMRKLNFSPEQVVFSGLSMGAYGALYYGYDINPHALVIGKPIASLGNVALNETLGRVGGFPTSLDIPMNICGETSKESAATINNRFWDKFSRGYWKETKFIVTYMIEDDYDRDAYEQILSNLPTIGVQIYGKGIHGRHNDETYGIINWFTSQYKEMLRDDFGRRKE